MGVVRKGYAIDLLTIVFVMPISRQRQKELRRMALSIVWQVLDGASREIDLQRVDREISDDEAKYVYKFLDAKAQAAFCEYENYKERHKV